MKSPKIMIHAAPDRMIYVNEFLLPRLSAQGFNRIEVWNDTEHKGCLWSYIESFSTLPHTGHTWHLQDDVLPDKRFYKWATSEWSEYPGIINGFGNKQFYHRERFGHAHNSNDMFYSFPCLRIPNKVCHDFLSWFEYAKANDVRVVEKLPAGKYIDYFFKLFIGDNPNEIGIYNFYPNIVEHVDEYITGSLVNQQRTTLAKAMQFDDTEALRDLKEWNEKTFGSIVRTGTDGTGLR